MIRNPLTFFRSAQSVAMDSSAYVAGDENATRVTELRMVTANDPSKKHWITQLLLADLIPLSRRASSSIPMIGSCC